LRGNIEEQSVCHIHDDTSTIVVCSNSAGDQPPVRAIKNGNFNKNLVKIFIALWGAIRRGRDNALLVVAGSYGCGGQLPPVAPRERAKALSY